MYINRPCALVVRGAVTYDTYGDPTTSVGTVSTVCELQPVPRIAAEAEREGGNIGFDLYKVYLPGTISPTNRDVLIIDNEYYEFTGPTNTRRNPRIGADVFTEGYVRRTD